MATCAICIDGDASTVTEIGGRTFRVCASCAGDPIEPANRQKQRTCLAITDEDTGAYCGVLFLSPGPEVRFCPRHRAAFNPWGHGFRRLR